MVEEMDIYLETSSRYQASRERKTCYLLEAVVDGVPYTKHEVLQMEETYHGAMVQALMMATDRIRRPVDVRIHTDDLYLISRLKELDLMRASGFKNRDGSAIAYADAWRKIAEKTKYVEVYAGTHSYSEWMQRQMEEGNV